MVSDGVRIPSRIHKTRQIGGIVLFLFDDVRDEGSERDRKTHGGVQIDCCPDEFKGHITMALESRSRG